jgi:Fe-Mn family superoxide dismutase
MLFEGKNHYRTNPLKISRDKLSPAMSKQNIDYHYDVHTKNYAKQANLHYDDFNIAGITLHNLWWATLQDAQKNNSPSGDILELINKKHKSFTNFKEQWKEAALSIQGSGWVALTYTGRIQTISNHRLVTGAIMLLDMWEHSYYPTHGPDKKKYIDSMWEVYNWKEINKRLVEFEKGDL